MVWRKKWSRCGTLCKPPTYWESLSAEGNVFVIFAFVAYLMILISIFADLFRDRALNGWYKALWFIFLIVFPYLAAFIYIIARGRGMAERSAELAQAAPRPRTRTSARSPVPDRPPTSPAPRHCSTRARSPRQSTRSSRRRPSPKRDLSVGGRADSPLRPPTIV